MMGSAASSNEGAAEPSDFKHRLGERLRTVRLSRGLSLQAAASASAGAFRASTLGAYERGERTLAAERLDDLAALYDVSVEELLPARGPLVIDLRNSEDHEEEELLGQLRTIVAELRGVDSDAVVSLRSDDRALLALLAHRR
jgi:transcriptional regulator with XRE-family HTH domain